MSRLTPYSFDYCPDDVPRWTEDTERADRENDAGYRPNYTHKPITWAQLQAAINGELQCCECAVRVVGDVETDNYLCPLCEGDAT